MSLVLQDPDYASNYNLEGRTTTNPSTYPHANTRTVDVILQRAAEVTRQLSLGLESQ